MKKTLWITGLLVLAGTVGATPASAGGQRCFGRQATIQTNQSGTVRGTNGDDVIVADHASTIYARGGDDRICVGRGDENIYGGPGNDKMDGEYSFGLTNLSGGPGADYFRRGVARFDGADGPVRVDLDKRIARGYGKDRFAKSIHFVIGSAHDDVLKGSRGHDVLYGAGGKDRLMGRRGPDSLTGDHSKGGDKHDETAGRRASDVLVGGDGDESFFAEPGDDRIEGQEGYDEVLFWGRAFTNVNLEINLTRGVARGSGKDRLLGIEMVWGGDGDDTMIGSPGPNRLIGGSGEDYLKGVGGRDKLDGDFDDDQLRGGDGPDLLNGGSGSDAMWGMGGADELHATGFDIFDGDYYDDEDDPNELYGGPGDDNLRGNDGEDLLRGDSGTDSADGDAGIDDCDAEVMVNCP